MNYLTNKETCHYEEYIEYINNPEKLSGMTEEDILILLNQVRERLKKERPLLKLRSKKSLFVGDTHGDFDATQKIAKLFLNDKSIHKIIFIGDYVDRGPRQLENINFLFMLKLCFPNRVYLLRGNHETILANATYGFRIELAKENLNDLYSTYNEIFAMLPVAAILNRNVFVVHGGIASELMKKDIDVINKLPKDDVAGTTPLLLELLWNDPREDVKGFAQSMRGSGIFYFGDDVFEEFMDKNKFKLFIRAHEVFPEGYKYFFGNKLLSLFTSIEYVGMYVKAKVAIVTKELEIKLVDLV